jgi:uncharacterized oxidoreductase
VPLIPEQTLRRLTCAIIEAVGTPAEPAREVGDSLVEANLVGHDSHGVLRLPWYIAAVRRGAILPAAEPAVIARAGATARVDGERGWGQIAARLATHTAIEIAAQHGIAGVTIVRCNHIGRVGAYVRTIAEAGMVGIALCNASPAVAPYGSYRPLMGTNPFAWAAPRGVSHEPLVLDFATAIVAEGKLRVARAKGEPLASGLIFDAQGRPTTDAADFYAGGALRTFGEHKGSGLSVLIELMARGLTGVDHSTEDSQGFNGTLIMALNIAAFAPPEQFTAAAERLASQVGGLAPASGFDTVLLPGEPEELSRRKRRAEGIPLPDTTWGELTALASELGVAV